MNVTEYFLAFAIGVLLLLMLAFLFRANFRTVLLLLLNSFIALMLLMLTAFFGGEQRISHYFLCGGFGIFGYVLTFLPAL